MFARLADQNPTRLIHKGYDMNPLSFKFDLIQKPLNGEESNTLAARIGVYECCEDSGVKPLDTDKSSSLILASYPHSIRDPLPPVQCNASLSTRKIASIEVHISGKVIFGCVRELSKEDLKLIIDQVKSASEKIEVYYPELINSKTLEKLLLQVFERKDQFSVSALKRALKQWANLDHPDVKNPAPLFLAIDLGDQKILEKLVAKGVDLKVVDQYGNTPLAAALLAKNFPVAKYLISKGALLSKKEISNFLTIIFGQETLEYISKMRDNFRLQRKPSFERPIPLNDFDGIINIINDLIPYLQEEEKEQIIEISLFVASSLSSSEFTIFLLSKMTPNKKKIGSHTI